MKDGKAQKECAEPEVSTVRIEDDFHKWLLAQASALRQQRYDLIDPGNLAEELEAIARKDRKELATHLQNLLVHPLKWVYEPSHRSNSWKLTINRSRDEIEDLIELSPSLRNVLNQLFAGGKTYLRTVRDATVETGNKVTFPSESPWALDQVLYSDFLPD